MGSKTKLLLFLALALTIHGLALRNPFYWDDLIVLKDNAWLVQPRGFWLWFTSSFADSNLLMPSYRPVLMLSFHLNSILTGSSPASFRVFNLLLHVLNAFLLIRLISKLLGDRSDRWMAWFVGILFVLHPIQTLGMNLAWERSTILETTFILMGIGIHLSGRIEGRYGIWRSLAQFFLFVCSVLTKESGIILPIYLLALDLLLFPGSLQRGKWRTAIFLYAPFVVLAAGLTYLRNEFIGSEQDHLSTGRMESFYAALESLSRHLGRWAIPHPLLLDDPKPVVHFPGTAFAICVLLLAFSGLAAIRWRNQPVIVLSLLFVWLGWISAWGPGWFYVPIAGLSSLGVYWMVSLSRLIRLSPAIPLGILIGLYSFGSVLQNLRYRSPERVWNDVVDSYPESTVAWENYGSALAVSGRIEEASSTFQKALSLNPEDLHLRLLAAKGLVDTGHPTNDLVTGVSAERSRPMSVRDRLIVAEILGKLGRNAEAEEALLEAVKENPSFLRVHLELGRLWEKMGKKEEAKKAFANALLLSGKSQNDTNR